MVFLDTNILVYAYDKEEKTKHQKAKAILVDCWNNRSGVLSTQVLQEFYVTLTRKLPKKLSIQEAREIIGEFLVWPVYQVMPSDILAATQIEEKYGYSFWDSLVIRAAQNSKTAVLYSEDMQDSQRLSGIKIVNPFN